jgi:hypothetical protein
VLSLFAEELPAFISNATNALKNIFFFNVIYGFGFQRNLFIQVKCAEREDSEMYCCLLETDKRHVIQSQ